MQIGVTVCFKGPGGTSSSLGLFGLMARDCHHCWSLSLATAVMQFRGIHSQDPTLGARLRPSVRPHLLPAPPTAPSGPRLLHNHKRLARASSYPKWNLQAVQSSRASPEPRPRASGLSYSGPPHPRRPGGGGAALLPLEPLIMSLRVARSARAVACSLRTALASCPPRPWAPSAAAVRTLRTGSALLSGKCGARGLSSYSAGRRQAPHY